MEAIEFIFFEKVAKQITELICGRETLTHACHTNPPTNQPRLDSYLAPNDAANRRITSMLSPTQLSHAAFVRHAWEDDSSESNACVTTLLGKFLQLGRLPLALRRKL